MVILDTSIVIDHLRLCNREKTILMEITNKCPASELAISVISIQELYEGRSTKNSEKELIMLSVISPLRVLPYTYQLAENAGKLARELSSSIQFADAAIAATALEYDAQVATLNTKDFQKIKVLKLYL